MGKPQFDLAQMAQALRETRGIVALAARAMRCHRKTVERYIKAYPQVREAYEESKDVLVDMAEMQLTQAVDSGDWPAVHFTLVTLGKERGYDEHAPVRRDDDEDWSELREHIRTAYGLAPGDLPGDDDEQDPDAAERETGHPDGALPDPDREETG